MREILFRGKRIIDGEWYYGSYLYPITIVDKESGIPFSIIKESIGQYTGLKDKNSVKIFEGDIIRDIITNELFEIIYEGHQFIRRNIKKFDFYTLSGNEYEVIGNKFDNPELLK